MKQKQRRQSKSSQKTTNLKRQKKKIKETMERRSNQNAKDKMTVVNPYLAIITLNLKGLNSPIKKQSGRIG